MVTSPHGAASAAGAAVLEQGGNAIEAAVAMGAVLSVVCPHFCGLGGDAVWMVADPEGDVGCFLGVGQAGADVVVEAGRSIPLRGAASALTTAGAVDSWQHALDHARRHWHGRKELPELLAPAIDLARQGFAVTPSQVHWLTHRHAEIGDWPGFAAVFLPEGAPSAAGALFAQPQLAETLVTIARDGARDFYDGALARRIAEGLAGHGVALTASDLAATRTQSVEPLSVSYRGVDLFAPPPPTQGLATLVAMGVLDRLDLGGLTESGADHIHFVVEAIKQAFLERDGIADPGFTNSLGSDALMPVRLDALAARIGPQALAWPHVHRSADTVFFGAVDPAGRCASVLQSTYFDWGSGVVAGDTGIIWHNRGAGFSSDPTHPNGFAPGKRPFMTLNPGLATRDGRPCLIYGTQGADGQPQTLALLLTRLIDFGLTPEAALRAPRFLLGRTFSDSRDSLKLEDDVGSAAMAELERRGHDVAAIAAQSPLAGQAGIIAIGADGSLSGGHDPRGEGSCISVMA